MQIVINISDNLYKKLKESPSCDSCAGIKNCDLIDMIVDGIVLPKGHGRLIDADVTKCSNCGKFGCENSELCSLYNAPTVIEADKEM